MGKLLRHLSLLRCNQGSGLSFLSFIHPAVQVDGDDAAHMLHVQMFPFGMCKSPKNPAVQANKGNPVPCLPLVYGWKSPSSVVKLGGFAAIHSGSSAPCVHGGTVSPLPLLLSHVDIKK
jgi:hypothetical protein